MIKRLIIATSLITLFSTYINHDENLSIKKFRIKEIAFENNFILDKKDLKKKLDFLYEKNIFLLKSINLEKKLDKIDFIDSYEIKKIYPNKLKIKIFEREPIAVIQDKNIKYYFTKKYKIIEFFENDKFSNLPIVIGGLNNFKDFYRNLEKSDISIREIEKIYYYKSGRWDLITKNKQTVKLPSKNYTQSINNFVTIKDQSNFNTYKIFDYRISDQLILR